MVLLITSDKRLKRKRDINLCANFFYVLSSSSSASNLQVGGGGDADGQNKKRKLDCVDSDSDSDSDDGGTVGVALSCGPIACNATLSKQIDTVKPFIRELFEDSNLVSVNITHILKLHFMNSLSFLFTRLGNF